MLSKYFIIFMYFGSNTCINKYNALEYYYILHLAYNCYF